MRIYKTNRGRFVSAVVAMGIAAGAVTGMTGCAAQFGNASCDFNVQNAHNRHSNKEVMNAKAVIKCTAEVTDASMTIKMQRKQGNSWVDVSGTEATTRYTVMQANRGYQFATRDVTCKSGTYRAGAHGSAKLNGKPAGSAQWQYGNASDIKC